MGRDLPNRHPPPAALSSSSTGVPAEGLASRRCPRAFPALQILCRLPVSSLRRPTRPASPARRRSRAAPVPTRAAPSWRALRARAAVSLCGQTASSPSAAARYKQPIAPSRPPSPSSPPESSARGFAACVEVATELVDPPLQNSPSPQNGLRADRSIASLLSGSACCVRHRGPPK